MASVRWAGEMNGQLPGAASPLYINTNARLSKEQFLPILLSEALLISSQGMASTFIAATGKDHTRPNQISPQNSFKKGCSANPQPPSPSCTQGHDHPGGGGLPKCVCAPATHAGSFKCRLHRVNSHGHSTPTTPPSSSSALPTGTIEAQCGQDLSNMPAVNRRNATRFYGREIQTWQEAVLQLPA
ncbi:hypothetical protein Taro_020717 [Colocasia esculenta]|uniref:Uncharacterized protein n=1 Tax=Colocasia esculenta TaxID=4460 RepID=A0A843UX33_COLES|nr:hypothetical protein [Colocasia esculenta]